MRGTRIRIELDSGVTMEEAAVAIVFAAGSMRSSEVAVLAACCRNVGRLMGVSALADSAGIGRDTVRTVLRRLREDGWMRFARFPDGTVTITIQAAAARRTAGFETVQGQHGTDGSDPPREVHESHTDETDPPRTYVYKHDSENIPATLPVLTTQPALFPGMNERTVEAALGVAVVPGVPVWFTLTPSRAAFARRYGFDDPGDLFEHFRDYWANNPKAMNTADWEARWRYFIRIEARQWGGRANRGTRTLREGNSVIERLRKRLTPQGGPDDREK